jgi:Zn-dependent protease with chaperone function
MVRRTLLAAACLVLAAPSFAAAPLLTVTSRDGQRQAFTFEDFDNKRLTFELKVGKKDRELDLRGISAIQFPPNDTASVSPTSDSLDVFMMVDGKTARGTFRRMDDQKVYARLTEGGNKELRLASLRQITFSPSILDVDRREFGKGFNLFGDDVEVEIAKGFASEVEADAPVLQDAAVDEYVSDLGHRVAASSKRPDLPYEFKVVNSGQVNAFTVGGGKVYVYRGLLEQMGSESELAGVLAHEIGHNVGKHTVRQLSKTLLMQGIVAATGELVKTKNSEWGEALKSVGGVVTYFTTLKYSRDDEREADFLGVYNLYAQGMDPNGMVSAFETLKRNEAREPSRFEVFFQTHPSLDERIENTSGELRKLNLVSMRKDSPAFHAMEEHLGTLPRPIAKQVLAADTLRVEANVKRAWAWKIDTSVLKDCMLRGKFRAYGGSGNDIRVLVLDEPNYQNFWNGHKATPLYDSGVLTTAEFKVPVSETGTYHLVLDNTFSMFTDKAVVLSLVAEHTE